MSGQYPGAGMGQNSMGSAGTGVPPGSMMQMHRGQFNPQQQQQMMNTMNQMGGVGGGGVGGMGQNAMATTGPGGHSPMMQMGGYPQGNMMQQPQPNQMQHPGGGGGGGMGMGQVPMGNAMVGMQSPSHMQQQMMQMQQQQQQMNAVGGASQMGMVGVGGATGAGPGMNVSGPVGGMMQQQINVGPAVQAQMPPTPMQHQQQLQQQAPQSNAQPVTQQQPNSNMLAISQPNPHKEINIVALSRLGQETVQDITSRFQEIFAALKIIQPTANRDNNTEKKVQEYFRTIRLLFKRVRIIYEKCNDGYPQGMEYTQVESLIPYRDELDHRNEPTQCEEYRKALQENQELIETVKLKNRQLREIIDRTRVIIWEINTMLSMRRS